MEDFIEKYSIGDEILKGLLIMEKKKITEVFDRQIKILNK